MLRSCKRLLVLIILSLLTVGTALPAAAQVAPANCDQVGLTHRAAVCLRSTIDTGTVNYFGAVTAILQDGINAAITLAVVLYGVLLSFGMVEKLGRDTFVLLIKITAVVFFVGQSPLIYNSATRMMDGIALEVVSFVPPSGPVDATATSDFSRINCLQVAADGSTAGGNPMPVAAAWLGVDCLLDSIIGIKVPRDPADPVPAFNPVYYNVTLDNANPARENRGLSRGLLNFFFSSLQSSVFGLVLGVVGALFIYGTILLIIQAFFTYIMGYMGIAFLTIVSPLFIPMVLFRETKQYFDKWAKLMISFALQPVLMLVFIMMTITAVDLAVFSGSYSIMYRIAGNESRAANFDLNEYLTRDRPTGANPPNCIQCRGILTRQLAVGAQVKADIPADVGVANTNMGAAVNIASQDIRGVLEGLKYSRCTPEFIAADVTGNLARACKFTYPLAVWTQDIQWNRMAAARVPAVVVPPGYTPVRDAAGNNSAELTAGQVIMHEVLASLFFCLMVVFVMNGLLAIVPNMVADLVGDSGQTPNLVKASTQVLGSQAGAAASSLTQGMKSMVTKR